MKHKIVRLKAFNGKTMIVTAIPGHGTMVRF